MVGSSDAFSSLSPLDLSKIARCDHASHYCSRSPSQGEASMSGPKRVQTMWGSGRSSPLQVARKISIVRGRIEALSFVISEEPRSCFGCWPVCNIFLPAPGILQKDEWDELHERLLDAACTPSTSPSARIALHRTASSSKAPKHTCKPLNNNKSRKHRAFFQTHSEP
ncbi:hypothetical protein CKAN_01639300 [Cinnamomum micranthum f. kanehirae]|uniref:Uncharacterized protein n=1 Tax=Cinnamomum micranthum f. kanehirae TaxID=337451 RepID=A0A3S3QP24_9MAGN|nr:hypothetical protein CKAN_01639300 [Cinnamomum micranthum f. kanehirae]